MFRIGREAVDYCRNGYGRGDEDDNYHDFELTDGFYKGGEGRDSVELVRVSVSKRMYDNTTQIPPPEANGTAPPFPPPANQGHTPSARSILKMIPCSTPQLIPAMGKIHANPDNP